MIEGVTRVSCSCPVMLFYISGANPWGFAPTTSVITGVSMTAKNYIPHKLTS
jgi:hypothetical protein